MTTMDGLSRWTSDGTEKGISPSDLLRRKGFNPDIADKMSRYDHGIREKQKKGDEV